MLALNNISKIFNNTKLESIKVFENINLRIEKGDFITIVGPSGTGKTTLLKIISGFVKPTSGQVLLNDELQLEPSSKIGLIPQDIFLFPWLTVKENIAFGLKIQGRNKNEIEKIINNALDAVDLSHFAEYYPNALSRGMQQKIAFARTMALDQEIILMDEPFASLDYHKKIEMQEFIQDLWLDKKKTIIMVTHDLDEAIYLSKKILFINKNKASEIIDIPFLFPRNFNLRGADEFQSIKNYLYNNLSKDQYTAQRSEF